MDVVMRAGVAASLQLSGRVGSGVLCLQHLACPFAPETLVWKPGCHRCAACAAAERGCDARTIQVVGGGGASGPVL